MRSNRRHVAARFVWRLVVASLLCVAVAWPALAQQRVVRSSAPDLQGNSTVRVMTRNMDAGTDLNYLIGVTDPQEFALRLLMTIQEVEDSRIPDRAARLAQEIIANKPDLVALQEATFWRLPAHTYDQLELLMSALNAGGAHYRVLDTQTLTDVIVPMTATFSARFTDHNAILVRTDLPPGHLEILGNKQALFKSSLPIPIPGGTVPQLQGWMAADVRIRGARCQFVNTHLMSALPGVDVTVSLQEAQAGELIEALQDTTLPVLLAGDFNSDASGAGIGPDKTAAASMIGEAGFIESWPTVHPAEAKAGFTWPLFLEDQYTGYPPAYFVERIDLIFSFGGPVPTAVVQTGTTPDAQNLFASDHIGVVADFALDNHRPDVPVNAVSRK